MSPRGPDSASKRTHQRRSAVQHRLAFDAAPDLARL